MGAATDLAADQSCAFRRLDVLRGGLQGNGEGLRQLAHRPLAIAELTKHLPPRGVGEGVEDTVQYRGVKINHEVEYRLHAATVNPLVEYALQPTSLPARGEMNSKNKVQ